MSELAILEFESQAAWEKWLEENHRQPDSVWLKFAKKNSGVTTVGFIEAIETAICYGWIDSVRNGFNDKFFIQKFSPRRPGSVWSKINVERVEALIKQGRMKPAGLAEVEAAKADGRWEAAYEGQSRAEAPADFLEALAMNKKAAEFYETISKANKYAIIYRLHNSKKPETRAANIQKFIAMLAEGKTLH